MGRRRSLAPLAVEQNALAVDKIEAEREKKGLGENDDARERRIRRKSLAALRRQRKSLCLSGDEENDENDDPNVTEQQIRDPRKVQKALESYSAVIKLCSSNKVDLKNTWSLNLIDHIDDILDSHKGSFQKASCTLQASVQIYEKRVDSTHVDTYKMLENVNRTGKRSDADGEAHRDARKKQVSGGKGKSTTQAASTLETNLSNITTSKLDREYHVDPLYKKMSKTFDEGGAKGMLLNHLYVHEGPRLVFDTSEAMAFPCNRYSVEEKEPHIENSFHNLEALGVLLTKFDVAYLRTCKSLDTLQGNSTANKGFEYDGSDEIHNENKPRNSISLVPDVSNGDDADDYDDVDYDFGGHEDVDYLDHFDEAVSDGNVANKQSGWRDDDDIDEAEAIEMQFLANQSEGRSDYSYYTANAKASNWAGPTHWKVGRSRTALKKNPDEQAKPKRKSKTKSLFFVDFGDESIPDWEAIIKEPKKLSSLTLAKKARLGSKQHRLPEDVHYSPADLCKLFLRPKNFIKTHSMETQRQAKAKETNVHSGHEDDYSDGGQGGGYEDDFGDFDDHCADENGGGSHDTTSALFGIETNLVQPIRHVEKIQIGHARKAKRVDVKRLKMAIWDEIEEEEEKCAESDDTVISQDEQEQPKTKSFCNSISHLAPKLDDENITVPYYFICILHLANEKGLELEGCEDLSDFIINAS